MCSKQLAKSIQNQCHLASTAMVSRPPPPPCPEDQKLRGPVESHFEEKSMPAASPSLNRQSKNVHGLTCVLGNIGFFHATDIADGADGSYGHCCWFCCAPFSAWSTSCSVKPTAMLTAGFARSKMCYSGKQAAPEHFSKLFDRGLELPQLYKDHCKTLLRSSRRILETFCHACAHMYGSSTVMGLVCPIQN